MSCNTNKSSQIQMNTRTKMKSKSEDKTIPFLRRLVEMLRENEDVISFVPGNRRASKKQVGQIIIHNRVKVEGDILPKYFNHASFASLRRQLNYFHFVRVGKGRQIGATYRNDAVYTMDDILRLKRRSLEEHELAAAQIAAEGQETEGLVESSPPASPESRVSSRKRKEARKSPNLISPAESSEDEEENNASSVKIKVKSPTTATSTAATSRSTDRPTKKKKTANAFKTPTVVLDLTKPPEGQEVGSYSYSNLYGGFPYSYPAPITAPSPSTHGFYPMEATPVTPPASTLPIARDEEVLEGCNALLALQCQPVSNQRVRQVTN